MPVEYEKTERPSFFSARNHIASPVKGARSAEFIDVGGNRDSLFRSVAAAVIDNFLTRPRKQNNEFLSKLLSAYYLYFPQYRSSMPGLVTTADRMQQLINRMPMGELVQTIAYVLRQIAVTELCSKPLLYRSAFIEMHENNSSVEAMREQGTRIDESVLAALSYTLSMPIEVQVVERLKTLPLRRHYNLIDDTQVQPVIIKRAGIHFYEPQITSTERFLSVGTQLSRSIQPVKNLEVNDPSLSELLVKIAEEDKRLVKSFEDRYRQLSLMVEAQELDLEKLLAIYVKGMSQSEDLLGRVACVSAEHGNQAFFDTILRAQHGESHAVNTTKTHDKAIVNELIHAIARALTIGQMSEDKVFAEIEATQSVTSTCLSR